MEIEKVLEVTEETAGNAITEALASGLDVRKRVLIGIGTVVIIGTTVYVIKKKPLTKLRAKIAERKANKTEETEEVVLEEEE